MTSLNSFEAAVLSRIIADYEAPNTIIDELSSEFNRTTEERIKKALLCLAKSGLAQAYVYDPAENRYIEISANAAECEGAPWFMATREGIERYESQNTD